MLTSMVRCRIRENAWIARIAAWKLKASNVAIVVGETIYLHNATSKDLTGNLQWFRHEVAHIRQFRQHGFLGFIFRYLWESIRHGYNNNRYEVEARMAESEDTILQDLLIED